MKKSITALVLFSLAFLLPAAACGPPVTPAPDSPALKITAPVIEKAAWQEEWEKTLAGAKREGRVSIANTAGSYVRDSVGVAFKEKYGIEVDYLGATISEIITKITAERRAGLYLRDIVLSGVASLPPVAEALEPMETSLILPEVKDPKAWRDGRPPLYDNEGKMFMYLARVGPTVLVNKELVKPEEIKSWLTLLEPKWKGKLLLFDPSMPGAGNALMATLGEIMGVNYLKELAKQELVVNRDKRLQIEWVARGKYLVGIAFDFSNMEDMRDSGVPLAHVVPAEGSYFGSAHGGMAMLNRPANPNAAKIFINWFLSKEGQTFYAKTAKEQSRRLDVLSELAPDRLLREGVKYIDGDTPYMLDKRVEMLKLSKEIFAAQYK